MCIIKAKEYESACQHVFWPGMNAEFKEWIKSCTTCQVFYQAHCKETFKSDEIPEQAWEKIGCDLFSYQGKLHIMVSYMYNLL